MERFARIVVDPSRRVAELDRRVLGSFVEHMGRCVYTGIYEPDHPAADDVAAGIFHPFAQASALCSGDALSLGSTPPP